MLAVISIDAPLCGTKTVMQKAFRQAEGFAAHLLFICDHRHHNFVLARLHVELPHVSCLRPEPAARQLATARGPEVWLPAGLPREFALQFQC